MSSFYYERHRAYSAAGGRPITYAVQRLIIITTIVFAAQLLVAIPVALTTVNGLDPEWWLALNPRLLRYGAVWQLFTYIFLHGGLLHLFFNMMTLYFFGPDVERILSTRQFFRFYFLCGAVGGLCQFGLALWQRSDAPTIGASGAALGVLAAYAVAYPKREVYLMLFPFPVYVWAVAVFVFIMSLMSDPLSPRTAWAAHAGGMVFGFAYMKFLPSIRAWVEQTAQSFRQRHQSQSSPKDRVGEAVDNIFKFDEEKKRRK